MTRRHTLPYNNHKQILQWLNDNIQENYYANGDKFSMSSVGQFIEWRSKDSQSWILRVAGIPARVYVEIKDEEWETVFLLRWG